MGKKAWCSTSDCLIQPCLNQSHPPCHLKATVSEFGDDIFSTDRKILFCKLCETKAATERKFTVQQHVGRKKHIQAMQLASKKKSTQLLLQETASMKENK